jgi:predicted phage terminase large subunit-like protein
MDLVDEYIKSKSETVSDKKFIKTSLEDNELLASLLANPFLIQRELNDRSLYEFLKWAWPEISGHPFIDNWHISYLCGQLEEVAYQVGERRPKDHDLLINISPGSTKTIICTIVFPVWCWTKWYWMRFITASYSSTLALESAEYSRDLIKSSRFAEMYPELDIKSDKDTKTNYKIIKRVPNKIFPGRYKILLGGNRYSTSVGGTLTGFHGDIIIWDDPINPQQAFSDIQLEVANNWIDQTLPTRKTNKAVSVVIGIMQRLHQNDPSGHILEKGKTNLKHVCLPGEILHEFRSLVRPRTLIKYYQDGLFDVNRLSLTVLNELEKDLGQYGYAGQIGQNPAPAGGGMFKVEHFQMISEIYDPRDIVRTVRYWDKAATAAKGAKYTVGVKMSLMRSGKFLVDDVKRGLWRSDQREDIIRQTAEVDGPNVFTVVEQEPGSGGKESAEGTIRNLAGFMVSAEKPTGDKEYRADPFSVQVNNGNVLLRIAEWNKTYKDEFILFPNSTYKDQVDASSGAFNYLVKKKEVKRWR